MFHAWPVKIMMTAASSRPTFVLGKVDAAPQQARQPEHDEQVNPDGAALPLGRDEVSSPDSPVHHHLRRPAGLTSRSGLFYHTDRLAGVYNREGGPPAASPGFPN